LGVGEKGRHFNRQSDISTLQSEVANLNFSGGGGVKLRRRVWAGSDNIVADG